MTEYVYVVFCGNCLNSDDPEESKVFKVTIRLTKTEFELQEDTMFDDLIGTFNSGLPEGWFIDENPEINNFTTKEGGKYLTYPNYKGEFESSPFFCA